MILISKSNEKIKLYKSLKDSTVSKSAKQCTLETEKIINDLVSQLDFKCMFILESLKSKYQYIIEKVKCNIYYIDDLISKYLSNTSSPSGIYAIVNIPKTQIDLTKNYLVLDNVQDPSNVGSIIRSAKAFNIDNIYFINSAYPYSTKVIRSSMGYVFNVNIIDITKNEFLSKNLKNLYSANMSGSNLYDIDKIIQPYGIVLGSEGQGVDKDIEKECSKIIKIPMNSVVDSLNVSVSCGIILSYFNNINK